jgi:tetratricopeptide (TPR) repeat protein
MADNRKPFRPRRLAIGMALVLLGAIASAHAQDAGLKNGAAALNAGKYDNAVRMLSATVNSGGAAPSEAAKALYLRGIAYRKLGQPSRAIADLGAAIWLGLPGSDRVRAQVNRGLAYRSAGLSKEAEADFAAARKSGGSGEVDKIIAQDGAGGTAIAAFSTEVRPEEESISDPVRGVLGPSFGGTAAPARTADAAPRAAPESAGAWSTSVSQGATQESGSRVSRWWGSVTDTFSSSEPASQPAPPPAAAPAPAPTRTAAAPAATQAAAPSSWTTEVHDSSAASSSEGGTRLGRWISRTTGSSDPAPAPTATAAASGGIYRLQLANSRTEAEAKALWQKAAGQSQQLASARPQIEKVDIGDFGTFYSLKIGPFADKAQSQSLCNSLKRGGIDCSVATPDGL